MRTVEGLCHFSWALHCQMLKITERVVMISKPPPRPSFAFFGHFCH